MSEKFQLKEMSKDTLHADMQVIKNQKQKQVEREKKQDVCI